MKKAIIVLTIAALPFAASAEVVLYGQVKSTITSGQVKIKGNEGTEKARPRPVSTTILHASASKAAKNFQTTSKPSGKLNSALPFWANPTASVSATAIPSSAWKASSVRSASAI